MKPSEITTHVSAADYYAYVANGSKGRTRTIPDKIDGYEYTGEFREPRSDEWFLDNSSQPLQRNAYPVNIVGARLILHKLPSPPPRKRYIFEETGEIRLPKGGEFYALPTGSIFKAFGTYDTEYPILTLRVEIIQD